MILIELLLDWNCLGHPLLIPRDYDLNVLIIVNLVIGLKNRSGWQLGAAADKLVFVWSVLKLSQPQRT